MRQPRFEVYSTWAKVRDSAEMRLEWRWRLKSANGRIIATGEAHTRERDAWRAIHTVKYVATKAQHDGMPRL